MPPLDDRPLPPSGGPMRRRDAARGPGQGHWLAGQAGQGVFSQPRAQTPPAPYPRRYPPQSWGGPAPQSAPQPSPQTGAPSPRPDAVRNEQSRADGRAPATQYPPRAEPPASLTGAVPAVEAYVPPPRPDALPGRPAYRRTDPSPSRLAYRLNRLWLTPLFRHGITMGLPALMLAGAIALYFSDADRRGAVIGIVGDLRAGFEARPEFRVDRLLVQTETPQLARAIADRLDIDFPASSFHLDLSHLRARVEALDLVESAALRIDSGRVLEIRVIEREPAFVWRQRDGLALIDAEGHRVALLRSRAARADLPLIAGDGAAKAVAEARRLLAAAEPLGERLHALVRIGERRWDVVLAGDQRIMLPARGAVSALERVLALDSAPSDLLSRDVTAVDMRNPSRPTIRLTQQAMAELHRIRSLD